jgi:hypothetical protein
MADMARLLLIYHYGGIYMDTDFYCHRPFSHLIDNVIQTMHSIPSFHEYLTNNLSKDLLVVSLEPKVHANLFRHKERVLIQDFFLATPKHPFFKWLLDDRNNKSQMIDYSYVKGPFSYAIEKDVDLYRQVMVTGNKNKAADPKGSARYRRSRRRLIDSMDVLPLLANATDQTVNQTMTADVKSLEATTARAKLSMATASSAVTVSQMTNSVESRKHSTTLFSKESYSFTPSSGIILELREDVLHPLIDATNSRLYEVCEKDVDNPMNQDSCRIVSPLASI